MAQLPLTVPSVTGVAPTATAASAGGDTVANYRGKTFLRVINGGGSSINVTLVPTQATASSPLPPKATSSSPCPTVRLGSSVRSRLRSMTPTAMCPSPTPRSPA